MGIFLHNQVQVVMFWEQHFWITIGLIILSWKTHSSTLRRRRVGNWHICFRSRTKDILYWQKKNLQRLVPAVVCTDNPKSSSHLPDELCTGLTDTTVAQFPVQCSSILSSSLGVPWAQLLSCALCVSDWLPHAQMLPNNSRSVQGDEMPLVTDLKWWLCPLSEIPAAWCGQDRVSVCMCVGGSAHALFSALSTARAETTLGRPGCYPASFHWLDETNELVQLL